MYDSENIEVANTKKRWCDDDGCGKRRRWMGVVYVMRLWEDNPNKEKMMPNMCNP